MSSAKFVLYKPSRTGLGDRLRSLACAALYAEQSGRALVVDWRDGLYGAKGEDNFCSLFRLKNVETSTVDAISQTDVAPPAWIGRLSQSLADVYDEDGWGKWDRAAVIARYQISYDSLFRVENTVVVWEFTELANLQRLLPQSLRSLSTDALEKFAFNRYVEFADQVTNRVVSLRSSNDEQIIGVHVRSTNEFSSDKGISISINQYIESVERIRGKLSHARIFLATDNQNVRDAFRTRYGALLLEFEKWFPKPGEPMHLSDDACKDRAKLAFDAALDLCALSRANALVVTNASSFSICASLMSVAPPNLVLHPKYPGAVQRMFGHVRSLLPFGKTA